jgi:hypothetical protein
VAKARGVRRWGALALAALLLHLVLVQPNHPDAMTWGALRLFAHELPVILLAMLALPAGVAVWVRGGLAVVLTAIAVLKIADFASFVAFNRRFNPVVDMNLVVSSWDLLSGTLGRGLAGVVVALAVVAVAGLAWGIWWATGVWARERLPRGWRIGAGVGAVAMTVVAVADMGRMTGWWEMERNLPGTAFTARVGYEKATSWRRTLADLRAFRTAAATDPWVTNPPALDRTGTGDVIVVFIESYGRASVDNALYAPTHLATLAAAEAAIAATGAEMRSGWLRAPMTGGQSWLAHSSVGAGLWISDQTRYRSFLQSGRRMLWHKAQDAGFTTAAVMPAVVKDWPEAEVMGFDMILPAADLGYRGLPFNWVTMPDQFTLVALDRLVRDPVAERVFAQVVLISSHAPWVPVPDMIAWEDVGDGTEFNAMATAGDPPEVVWRDRDRVREQYRLAVDYSLTAIMEYVARQGGEMPLFVILGDHQAAGFVAQSDSFDVPVHVIGPPEVIAAIDGWDFAPGLVPDAGFEAWPMDQFRDRFLAAFSSE